MTDDDRAQADDAISTRVMTRAMARAQDKPHRGTIIAGIIIACILSTISIYAAGLGLVNQTRQTTSDTCQAKVVANLAAQNAVSQKARDALVAAISAQAAAQAAQATSLLQQATDIGILLSGASHDETVSALADFQRQAQNAAGAATTSANALVVYVTTSLAGNAERSQTPTTFTC